MRRARLDDSLRFVVRSRRPLRYDEGADAALDRPAHVRAGSSVSWVGGRLAVVQDDASFIAIVGDGTCRSVTLPAGKGGKRQFDERRGNKKDKLDLEACVVVDGVLFAFGSGSAAGRDRVVRWAEGGELRVSPAPRLYAALRERTEFSGSELNVEGALVVGTDVWFFNRGNGAAVGGLHPVDATVPVSVVELLRYLDDETGAPLPVLGEVTTYDLGTAFGCRLTFTDATRAFGRSLYLAAAEASPDATRDGPVAGVAIGVLDEAEPRYALVVDETGAPLTDKLEGLTVASETRLLAVVDKDDPDVASELVEIEARF